MVKQVKITGRHFDIGVTSFVLGFTVSGESSSYTNKPHNFGIALIFVCFCV